MATQPRPAEFVGVDVDPADALALAAALHRTLLPPSLPAVPGLEIAVRYQPGGGGIVGGDWYDVVPLTDSCVALIVGDVAGHGVESAAAMGQLRNGLRAYLVDEPGSEADPDPDPGRALARLNMLARRLLPDEMATAIVACVDVPGRVLRLATAGHLPPLVIPRGSGAVGDYAEVTRVPALGLADATTAPVSVLPIAAGTVMLFFTDGLVEVRGEAIDEGLARLQSLVGAGQDVVDLEGLCDRVLTLVPDTPDADDVAVLAVRFD